VLDATLDQLAESGYDAMTIAKVAARAGVHKTAVYRWWPTKGALLADALLDGSTDIEPPDSGDFATDLLALLATAPRGGSSGDRLAHAVAVSRALDAAGPDPDVARVRAELWERRLTLVRHAVDRAKARGEMPDDADPDLVLDVLFGVFHSRVVAREQPFTAAFVEQVMGLIRSGST
jgi:AcrR family transcriptional regulator